MNRRKSVLLGFELLEDRITPGVILANPGNQTSQAGSSAGIFLSGSDTSGFPLMYTATGLPAWLNLSSTSGAIGGFVPSNAATGNNPYSVTVTAYDYSTMASASQTFTWSVNPPSITPTLTMTAQVLAGHQVLLSGVLVDGNPAGAAVTFSGAASGSTFTDVHGNFSFTTSSATLGTVFGTAVDQSQQWSNRAMAYVSVAAPSISMAVTGVGQSSVSISGKVNDIDSAGATVTYSGVANGSVTADSNGNFSFTAGVSSSGPLVLSETDAWGQPSNVPFIGVSRSPSGVATYLSPQLTLSAQVLAGHQVLLTGTLMDNNPAGATVTFGGAVAGSVATNADGTFSYMTTTASLGSVHAMATDQNHQTSNPVSVIIMPPSPVLSMYVSNVTQSTVTITGHLSDIDLSGETIQFGGLTTGSATTDANGNFTFTANTAAFGNLSAVATDLWGQATNTEVVPVLAHTLSILNFGVVQMGANVWSFIGQVVGDNSGNLAINFGGLPSLNGVTMNALADGNFDLIRQLQANEWGTATAQALDTVTLATSATVQAVVHS